MADHDQQRLIELDANESPKVVFKVSYYFILFAPCVFAVSIMEGSNAKIIVLICVSCLC